MVGTLTTDRTAPASTSDALASALSETEEPSSTAVPQTAPVTTGASLIPAIFTVTVAQLRVPLPSRIAYVKVSVRFSPGFSA